MIVEPLKAEAMAGFVADARMGLDGASPEEIWAVLADRSRGWAWSVAHDDGTLAGACGLYLHDDANPKRAEMWAVFSPDAARLMVGVTRRTLAVLEAARGQLEEIQAHVSRSFPQGKKWVLILGFKPTGESLTVAGGVQDRYIWRG